MDSCYGYNNGDSLHVAIMGLPVVGVLWGKRASHGLRGGGPLPRQMAPRDRSGYRQVHTGLRIRPQIYRSPPCSAVKMDTTPL